MNGNGDVRDVVDADPGVEVGDSDRLSGKTNGAASSPLNGTFWSSAGNRGTYDMSEEARGGDSPNGGVCAC